MKAIIFDTESTGFTEPRIVEAAWCEVDLSLNSLATFCQRYNPQKPIEFGAMATHHIMDGDLEGMPPYTEFSLPEGVEYLIGHNVDYDWKIIGEPPVKRICTLAIARHLFPDLDSHSQSAMMYYFYRVNARAHLKEAHSAEADVMNCRRVLHRLLSLLEPQERESWEALWNFSEMARIPTVISFGKHKGMAIKDLPSDYKSWLLRQTDVDPYLVKALRGEVA